MIKFGKPIFLFIFFANLVQSLVFFYDEPDELTAIPLVLLLAGVAIYFIRKGPEHDPDDFQVNIFLWAFSVRLIAGMIFYGWGLSKALGDEDASGYITGWTLASNWYAHGFDGFFADLYQVFFQKANVGQSLIWGIPMFIAGGPSRMIVSVVNSFAGALLVIVLYRLTRRIFGTEAARIAAFLVSFWASIVLFSAGTSKEILVILFEWSLLYVAIRSSKGFTVKDGFLALPASLALYVTRFYALYMVFGAFMARIVLSKKEHMVRNILLGTIAVGAVFVVLNAGGVITRDFARLDRQNTIIDQWHQNVAETTGSGVRVYSEYESGTVAVPVATLYFFFAPFPWEITDGSVRNGFAAVENLLIISILIIGFPALKIFFKDKLFETAPILVFCVMYAGFQIWGLSNVGLAWRHKQTVMPILFMIAAVGITQRKAGWRIITQKFSRKEKTWSVVPSA